MQYGSIGWSVGATLGYAQAVPEKQVIACIGDGSFQVCLVPICLQQFFFLVTMQATKNLVDHIQIVN